MHPPPAPGPSRPTFLPVILSTLTLGGAVLFLIFISAGFFVYVIGGVAAIFLVGLLHYLLWGALLDHETEGAREEAQLRDRLEGPDW